MKLKFLVRLVSRLLGMRDGADEIRADMFLPDWILALGMVGVSAAIAFAICFAVTLKIGFIVGCAIGVIIGVAAILCWRNQTIRVISEYEFEYSTFLGNKKVYSFSEIKGLKRNSDSFTLFVADEKVHIESCAVLSDRLIELINRQLETEETE